MLKDLHAYDIYYLSALFSSNTLRIEQIKKEAKNEGYGPLTPCRVVIPASAKRQKCSMLFAIRKYHKLTKKFLCLAEWHRMSCGGLQRGELHQNQKCGVIFDIYTPNSISDAENQILIVCQNAHTHPPPAHI